MKKTLRTVCLIILSVITLCLFAACGPNSDPSKAEHSLKEKQYSVIKDEKLLYTVPVETLLNLDRGNVSCVVSASKITDDNVQHAVLAIYFDKTSTAKSVYSLAKEKTDVLLKTVGIKYDGDVTQLIFKRSGSMIYAGTQQAIDDAK